MDVTELIGATTDAWNRRDRAAYLSLYSEDCQITAPGFTGKGHDAVALLWEGNMTAFPDNRVEVLRVVGGNGSAVEESVITGTHTGPLVQPDGSQLPPTGRRGSVPLVVVHDERDGRLVASRLYYDQLDLLAQLGLVPGR